MIDLKRLVMAGFALAAGCGDDGTPPEEEEEIVPLAHASKSSTIALSDDRARVAMVNPEDGSLSVFQTSDHSRLSKVATGGNPSSVVIASNSTTAFVANRADGTVVRVVGIDGGTPSIDATVEVGAEPVALALSPSGKKLFVAEMAESRVSIVDTKTMEVLESIEVDRPRALTITNNLDTNDEDETLVITQFFGVATPGGEAKDNGRTGKVRLYSLADLSTYRSINLAPIDSGFPRGGVAGGPTVTAFPNQLSAVAVANGRVFVTSTAASPEGPARFDNNVYPVVHVGDLASATEITGAGGSTNLARKIYDAIPSPSPASPRFIPGQLTDISFVDDSNVAYTIGLAGDVMTRITFGDPVTIGSSQNKQIDLAGNDTIGKCQNPTGLVVDSVNMKAYVNCWISRRLGVVALDSQSLANTFEASPAPANAEEASIQRGKRFYFTGRGRWSAAQANGVAGGEGWSACGSCHPDGYTDNVTWIFASGPRQSTSQDGSFSHGPGPQKQRIFNWTGIFDEHHDFERNTRDVSGGLGAITEAPTQADCNKLDKETQVSLAGINGMQKPLKELQDTALCGHKDWDDIDNFVKTIAPIKARKAQPADAVTRGRQLFVDGGCAKCHGGSGWTVSRRFFTPLASTQTSLAATPFGIPGFFPSTWMYKQDPNPQAPVDRNLVSAQPAIAADDTGAADIAVAVAQSACSLRNVGTFGVPMDTARTDELEIRPGAAPRAQGRSGYNVPSLYGLALGAPYLHHGQAPTLEELFTDARWQFHTTAGNANFGVVLNGAGKVDDLVAFLLSIDATTAEIDLPRDSGTGLSFDACPDLFQ
jgi:YVTN family beta-propeller protein